MVDDTTTPRRDLVWLPIDDLIPYARNAKLHTPEQVTELAASLHEFGWTNPVLISPDLGIIAGHGRVLAAYQCIVQGLVIPQCADPTLVPTITLHGLTETQRRAYALADNKLAERSSWQEELLRGEMRELTAAGVDPGLLGFERWEVDLLNDPDWEAKEKVASVTPSDEEGMTVIRVRCNASIKNDVADFLKKALAGSPYEGAAVEC